MDTEQADPRPESPNAAVVQNTGRQTKEQIQSWCEKTKCTDIWQALQDFPLEIIYSFTEVQLKEIAGNVAKGAGFYNYLHPPITPTEGKVTFLPLKRAGEPSTEGSPLKRPKTELALSSRTEFQSLKAAKPGETIKIAHLHFGKRPKHFHPEYPLLISSEMNLLKNQVFEMNDDALKDPSSIDRNCVLCGPMGVGKSYILWGIAAMAFAEGRCLLYISDAQHWMSSVNPLLAFADLFLYFNKDIINDYDKALLEDPRLDWDTIGALFPKYRPIVIIDEHIAVVERYEKMNKGLVPYQQWLDSFIKLNGMPPGGTVVLGASSHARFELNYLKNGMQTFKYFCQPLTRTEAKCLLVDCFGCTPDEQTLPRILDECNGIPRELLWFGKSFRNNPDCLATFRRERVEDFKSCLGNFFECLNQERRHNLLNTLSTMFKNGGGVGVVSELTGFIDLSLCYREKASPYYLQPLSPPATRAMLDFYVSVLPQQPLYPQWVKELQEGRISGENFENLVWFRLLHETLKPGGFKVRPFFLNGNPADFELVISFTTFIVLNDLDNFPTSFQNQPSLITRAHNFQGKAFPRWDFLSIPYFFQISLSTFVVHNNNKGSDIKNSFNRKKEPETELEVAIKKFTGKKCRALFQDKKFLVQTVSTKEKIPVKFIYVTLSKPNHPDKYKEFPDLLVLPVKEWKW